MKKISYPEIPEEFWDVPAGTRVEEQVRQIIQDVLERGDDALREYTARFDGVDGPVQILTGAELKKYSDNLNNAEREAIHEIIENVSYFAEKQKQSLTEFKIERHPGLKLGQRIIPMDSVGIYVPGGNFPLISTVVMCAVPAKVAGVKRVVMATPPKREEKINPYIAAAAYLTGVDEVVLAGGAQAVAALAYGTAMIKPVDKIVGPGNAYVAEAKRQVYGRVGIDFIAGPSEVMIIADESADPEIVAADMLAQSEHDVNASAILLSTDDNVIKAVEGKIGKQLETLPDPEIARQSIENNGYLVKVPSVEIAVEIANRKAPEHLELQISNAEAWIDRLKNYGSLFIGNFSAEVLGDYSAGVNHTLPTAGAARYTGGLSVFDFLKITTVLEADDRGFKYVATSSQKLAEMEGLMAHANAISVRQRKLKC